VRVSVLVLLLACDPAAADDGTPSVTERTSLSREPTGPLLHLDFVLPVKAESVGATTRRESYVLELGSRARLVADGTWWSSPLAPQPLGPDDTEDVARGWRAAYELSYDLGPFRLGATMALGRVDSRFERGTYRVVGVSASRTLRLSRWMLAWISLGVGRQQWFGAPPPGESDSTTVMLSIGTTFR
jgi:hypothetical protein